MDLPRSATKQDFKSKYRELIKKYHPDLCSEANKEQAEKLTQSINKAYRVIMSSHQENDS